MNKVLKKYAIYNRFKSIFIILFVLALPFDYYNFFGVSSFFSVSKALGIIYFLISLLDIKRSFRLFKIRKFLIPLFILWLWLSVQALINYSGNTSFAVFDTTFLMGIFLFWLIFNDLVNEVISLNKVLLAMVASMFLVSVLIPLGIGIEISREDLGGTRIGFFGMNPNNMGTFANIALVIVLAMILNPSHYFKKKTYLFVLIIPNLLSLIGLSGSRSAIFIAGVSIITSALFLKKKFALKLFVILLASILAFFSISEIMKTEVMEKRIEKTLDSGEVGEREIIWKKALEIFGDKPLFGWGKIGYEEQMIFRYGQYMDTHNIFLYVLVCGGMIGLVLYLYFLQLVVKSIRINYKLSSTIIMPLIFLIYLFNVSKSGGVIGSKYMWVLLAVLAASQYLVNKKIKHV